MDLERDPRLRRIEEILVSILQTGFDHPEFPEALKPKLDFVDALILLPQSRLSEIYKERVQERYHPFVRDNDLFQARLSALSREPAWADFPNKKIYFSIEAVKGKPEAFLPSLSKQVGHLSCVEREADTTREEEGLLMRSVLGSKIEDVDPKSKITLINRGYLVRRRIDGLEIGDTPGAFDTLLHHLFTDAYSIYLMSHVEATSEKSSFERRLDIFREAQDAGRARGEFYLRLLDFAEKLGWVNFLSSGLNTDHRIFIKGAQNAFGDEYEEYLVNFMNKMVSLNPFMHIHRPLD